jgi:hypothetical protein
MSKNMDAFDQLTGTIFGRLFEAFPNSVELNSSGMLEKFVEPEDFDGVWDFDDVFRHTVEWLERYDYIWIKRDLCTMGSSSSYELTLTERSLEVLKQTPDSLAGYDSLGKRFVAFSKAKASDTVGTLISLAVTSAIT